MNRPTIVALDDKAREYILRGVDAIYEPVRRTLGPHGANALLYRTFNRGPRNTNDGHTIAQVIEPENEYENLVATFFKESAKKTNDLAGDGTTTTITIGGKLIHHIFKLLRGSQTRVGDDRQYGLMEIRKQLFAEAEKIKAEIEKCAKKIESLEDLEKIAKVSVEDDELGVIIAKMVWETGMDGYIDVVEGFKGIIETEIIKGMRFPAKVGAKAFVNNAARFEMVAEHILVLITNHKIDNVADVAQAINPLLKENPKLAIFAPGFSEEVLVDWFSAVFTMQNGVKVKKPGVDIFPVHVPSLRTEQFDDLAIYFGATFINKDKGMKLANVEMRHLGFLEKLVVKDSDAREDAVATGGAGAKDMKVVMGEEEMSAENTSAIAKRIEELRGQIEETHDEPHKKLLERRIASMASAVGVIRVGASTQADSLYKKLKIEDAVFSSKAAMQEGYVKGGGLCLKEIADELPESLLTDALRAPYEQIQENAGGDFEVKDEIIDPVKSTRLSVKHAVSVVANLATVKMLIPEKRERSPAEGYTDIAKAIHFYSRLYNKQHSIIRENQLEVWADEEKLEKEALLNDHD